MVYQPDGSPHKNPQAVVTPTIASRIARSGKSAGSFHVSVCSDQAIAARRLSNVG